MPADPTEEQAASSEASPQGRTVMILGVSWHSGFCEGWSKAPECASQTAESIDARQFSLHGLWHVGKTYCGVPEALKAQDKQRKWLDMPELALDDDVKAELVRAMPGARSGLDRHEWIKHGTCSGDLAVDYYAQSLRLLDTLNGSAVQELFERNLGKALGESEIKAAFEQALGSGAGDKVRMRCRKDGDRQVITGLTIGLGKGDGSEADLRALVAAAGTTKFGCPEGIVDEAGLQ
ncbi:ribonuclease [Rhizobium sp. KVB221]|uniref:Ribonuclease n=1 Tax=Rhizobium setariae TaxID=2801340 RepID=A0A936YVW1_9HYPH|nr:ribonuclease [Rhizobium setariae]MBL0374502.1 ribonuclease [Rhizobium setariae]